MTKSKQFWAGSALISLAVMVFTGYSIYGRMFLHFSGDTIEVRPVPVPVPQEEDEDAAAKEDTEDKKEETKAGKETAAQTKTAAPAKTATPAKTARPPEPAAGETSGTRAVKTAFEYKDANAKSVLIAGSFTSWKDKKMTKKNGVWRTEVYILPGTYPYHFTVDGKKKLDPGKPKAPTGDSLVDVN